MSEVKYRSLERLGYPKFLAGTDGSIWRRFNSYDREMEGTVTKDGFRAVGLKDAEGVLRTELVHLVVLRAWVGDEPEGHRAAFRDNNKNNCALENLYWRPRGKDDQEEESADLGAVELVL